MEKSIDTAALPIFSAIRETFDIRKGDIRTYSPLTLAYIGDGIYDLVIRSMIVAQGNTKASQLHQPYKPSGKSTFPVRHDGVSASGAVRGGRSGLQAWPECEVSDYGEKCTV